jgi:hypothetical protein
MFLIVFGLLAALGAMSGALSLSVKPRAMSPLDFLAVTSPSQLASDHVTVDVAGAVEIGYQFKREKEERRPTAKVMAIPTNDRLLIVLAPLDHRGNAYTGIVQKMPPEVQIAIVEADLHGSMERLREWEARWTQRRGQGGLAADPGEVERPSLKELCLPLILDATTSGPYGLLERFGLIVLMAVFIAGGVLCIGKALRQRRGLRRGRHPPED